MVYDITSKKSFEESMNWYRLAREVCGGNLSIILVGNKTDLEEHREVAKEDV